MTVSVELRPKDVAWLSNAYEKKTVISPFNYIRTGGFTDDDRAELAAKGVITSQGGIAGAYAPLFDVVADADSFASVDLCSGPVTLRAAVLRRDTLSVSMTAEGDLLRWTMPANVDAITTVFENYTGSTAFRSADLSLYGPCDLAIVFTLLCDNYRQHVLGSMADNEFFAQAGMTSAEILQATQTITVKPHSLAPIVKQLCTNGPSLDTDRLSEILGTLEEQAMVEKHGDRFFLAGKASIFAGSFLVVENLIHLNLGALEDGQLFTTQAVMIQAGVHDILYLEQQPSGLRLTTLSSQAALKLLRDVI